MFARGMIFSLRTAHFERQLAFYRSLLGPPQQVLRGKWASFHVPGCRLVLWSTEAQVEPSRSAVQICFQVESLERALASLPAGIVPGEPICAIHGQEAFVHDTDGNRLILYEPEKPTHTS